MIRLYYAPGGCSLAVHVALEEAGATFEPVRLDFQNAEQRGAAYLAINPKGRVPALVTDDGVLTECVAILAWIAQTWPEARLAPLDDPWAFAQMQAFNAFLASSVHVAWAHVSRPGRYADGDDAAAAMRAKSQVSLPDFFALIEERFSDDRPYVNGESYTVSDPYLMVMTGWVTRRGMVLPASIPRVAAHHARIESRPATQRVIARETAPV